MRRVICELQLQVTNTNANTGRPDTVTGEKHYKICTLEFNLKAYKINYLPTEVTVDKKKELLLRRAKREMLLCALSTPQWTGMFELHGLI